MHQRLRQFAVATQLFSLLLAGGLAEGLHLLPGMAHHGHGCCHSHAELERPATASCCRHEGQAPACQSGNSGHEKFPSCSTAGALQNEEPGATLELGAVDDCAICKLLNAWREIAVASTIEPSLTCSSTELVAVDLSRGAYASHRAAHSRGPPTLG
ncbi:MAG: hypothetical protein ACIALR_07265 [Blastopirellula sp. JB062]